MRIVHRILDRMQRTAARSTFLVRLAILVRNQARCVIKYHLAESPDVNETGEVWLQASVAKRASRFVDVGANVGDWLGGIATLKNGDAFEALAIEPSRSAFLRLRERFGGDTRVTLVEAAAGDRAGSMDFIEEDDAGRGSTLVPGLGRLEGTQRTVTVTTLDAALENAGWGGADFVKIDAEGFDARVIRGAANALESHAIGVVQFEYNRGWQLAGETLFGTMRFLEERGYRTYLLKREGLYDLDYARYEEYFEYSNFVALDATWCDLLRDSMRGVI
jgi:FkbM family methyltransferase